MEVVTSESLGQNKEEEIGIYFTQMRIETGLYLHAFLSRYVFPQCREHKYFAIQPMHLRDLVLFIFIFLVVANSCHFSREIK